jgi:hypothetical protein
VTKPVSRDPEKMHRRKLVVCASDSTQLPQSEHMKKVSFELLSSSRLSMMVRVRVCFKACARVATLVF